MSTSISERVKQLRAERGWNQVELATRAGVKPGTIGNIEAGGREGSATTLLGIAKATGVRVEWLKDGVGPKVDAPTSRRAGISTIGEIEISAHSMPPPISWEMLLSTAHDLPQSFTAAVPDDALSGSPRGTRFSFSRSAAPEPGKAVIVRDKAGHIYMRKYIQGLSGCWSAAATNEAYATLDSERDGLEVLAVATDKWLAGGYA